ncbi:MAG: DJ-1/PfpI family protein [Kiloniellales bacterium]
MRKLAAVIFPGFELLDLYGPLEMLGMLPEDFALTLVAEAAGPVASGAGPQSLAELAFDDCSGFDLLLVPGGPGTRREIDNPAMTDFLLRAAADAQVVASVCTGSVLLARSGLLDGRKATSNKRAWAWVTGTSQAVSWQAKARWVEDGPFWTSSGVAAGIDMTLALIANLLGQEKAERVAAGAEYDWHREPAWDPFADLYGLR